MKYNVADTSPRCTKSCCVCRLGYSKGAKDIVAKDTCDAMPERRNFPQAESVGDNFYHLALKDYVSLRLWFIAVSKVLEAAQRAQFNTANTSKLQIPDVVINLFMQTS